LKDLGDVLGSQGREDWARMVKSEPWRWIGWAGGFVSLAGEENGVVGDDKREMGERGRGGGEKKGEVLTGADFDKVGVGFEELGVDY
jgi:hypothetical protein